MIVIALFMLFVPGLISLKMHGIEKVTQDNWQNVLFLYLIYTVLIIFLNYSLMFATYPLRTASFSPWRTADSNLYSVSFVFKYLFVALISAVMLPLVWKNKVYIKEWFLSHLRNYQNSKNQKNDDKPLR